MNIENETQASRMSSIINDDKLILLERKYPTTYEIHRGKIDQGKNLILTTSDGKFAERLVGSYNLSFESNKQKFL